MATYLSVFPTLDTDHVKATSTFASYAPSMLCDHVTNLVDSLVNSAWVSNDAATNQRFHIDLGSGYVIKRIYYENGHSSGSFLNEGVQNFTLWGSNSATAFAELTYGTDTGWTQLTTSQSTFDKHAAANAVDPKYITVTNTTSYRYYAFKFADRWGTGELWMYMRRIELQVEDAGYTSQYPTAHNDTYVKATTKYDTGYWPYFATDPAKSLTGVYANNAWLSASEAGGDATKRFHIDLGEAKIIRRIYYENIHSEGNLGTYGLKTFTFWGSNNATAFAELTYGTDTNWTQLTTSQATFDQHIIADRADPRVITITNSTAYRYYAIKVADNWGGAGVMGVRRIELQTENGYGINGGSFLLNFV